MSIQPINTPLTIHPINNLISTHPITSLFPPHSSQLIHQALDTVIGWMPFRCIPTGQPKLSQLPGGPAPWVCVMASITQA